MSDPVAISCEGLAARIDPLGAELLSLTDGEGNEYMTDADPTFWTGHAPLLFPIVGGMRDGSYRLGDAGYEMPKHGFVRHAEFAVVDAEVGAGADRAVFRLEDSTATRAIYPFSFAFEMEFALEGMTLAMTATIANRSPEVMPFSFGFHPAFAWPLPGGAAKEAHRVVFDRPEPAPVRRIDPRSTLMLATREPTPVEGNVLVPRAELFEADALIWDDLASRALRFGADGGAWLDIEFPDCPNLGIWQKPGARYLAIEPWQGYNDPEDFSGDFREKPGVVELAPGGKRSFRMNVTVVPA